MRLGRLTRIVTATGAALTVATAIASAPASAAAPSGRSTSSVAASPLLHRQARSDAELSQQIALQLKLAPGGKQTSRNEVSYDSGKFVVTYALPGARALAAPDCPEGWYCFYEDLNFGYPRGKLQDCGTQDLGVWGWRDRISSVDNRTDYTAIFKRTESSSSALFRVYAHENNPWVGSAVNDAARYADKAC
jgi:hypothetical protein